MKNAEIATTFAEMGEVLEYLGENPFRVRAYQQAARILEDLETPVEAIAAGGLEALEALPAIGPDLAEKIVEYLQTGEVKAHRELVAQVRHGILEVMRVPGVGPKTAKLLFERLQVDSLAALRSALEQKLVIGLPGFGEKRRQRLLEGLELVEAASSRRPLGKVLWGARELLTAVAALPGVTRAELCGSARRYQETVGDIDVLVTGEDPTSLIERIAKLPPVAEVRDQGVNRATLFLRDGIQMDVKAVPRESWGSGLCYFTGSKAHNIRLRLLAIERGMKLNEYGLWRGRKRVAGRQESEVYEALGLPLIPPMLREDRGEIEAAQKGTLPQVVTQPAIRGDLQMHSKWSDGSNSPEELVAAAAARGYEYLAITDHSPSVRVARGLSAARLRERNKSLCALNERTGGIPYVLLGSEVDILEDGSLDYPDDVLAEQELVLVSIHSHFGLPADKQTERIVRALENPHVHILAHPTARQLGRRPPIEADWERIFERARGLGKALEINGAADRIDLGDVLARSAGEHGVMISLGTDAHHVDQLRCLELAVGTAQRAWLTPAGLLNTRTLPELRAWLEQVRGR